MDFNDPMFYVGVALFALIPGFIANAKGRSFWVHFILSFIFSPLLGTILVLCLKRVPTEQHTSVTYNNYYPTNHHPENSTPHTAKQKNVLYCSNCGAQIAEDSVFCCYCGSKVR